MRRLLVLLLAAALLGGGTLVAGAGARPVAKHAKRSRDSVVRRGAGHRVLGRAWVLAQLPRLAPAVAPPAPLALPALPVTPGPPQQIDAGPVIVPADPPVVPSIGVTLRDTPAFTAQLSRTSVVAGAVRVQLANRGEDDHDLRVERTDGTGPAYDLPVTQPNRTSTATVSLDAGAWTLFCSLPGHRAAGMSATLTVLP